MVDPLRSSRSTLIAWHGTHSTRHVGETRVPDRRRCDACPSRRQAAHPDRGHGRDRHCRGIGNNGTCAVMHLALGRAPEESRALPCL